MLQVWGSAALLVAASALVGHAVSLLGARCRAAAPAVGLSLLILIASIAIRLPGRAATAAVLLLVVLVAAGALVAVRRGPRALPVLPLIVGSAAACGAAIPFIANGRVGLLGVSVDNDTAAHLMYAEALRSPVVRNAYGLPSGYPLGPHSLVDALSSGLGVRLDLAFTGLLIATVIITALVAAAALRRESAWKRLVVGVLGALLYLLAAYYAQGAFKETLLGLLLLAMVLHLEEVRGEWVTGSHGRWRALVPVSLLVAAGVYVFSYFALAWFGLTVVIWLAAEAAARPGLLRRRRAQLCDLVPPVAIAVGLLLVLLAPVAGRTVSFAGTVGVSPAATGAITATNIGNLAHGLSPYEALGIWNSPDFRFVPVNVFHAGELSALALGVLLLGLAWSVGRRELLLPAAVAACAIVYWRSNQDQSPYVTAKALVIAAPVVAVTGLRGLLCSPATPLTRWVGGARLAAAAVFVVFAAHSSFEALADEPVWPVESTRELLSLAKLTRAQTVLFLGNSDYAPWLFHDSTMRALTSTMSVAQTATRRTKPFVYGNALDFDSADPSTINGFRWVVTTSTPYASQPPDGFRLVRQLRMYELWERVRPIVSRQTLEPPGAPGAVLDCSSPVGRALSHRRGVAAVMVPPVIRGLTTIEPGGVEQVTLPLPVGRWELSLQYVSAVDIELTAGGERWSMPAYLDRPGPWFAVGSVGSVGTPVSVTLRAARPSSIIGFNLAALTNAIVATRSPDIRQLIPLSRSCGRYIDWYRG
jgi:hypothetical protein